MDTKQKVEKRIRHGSCQFGVARVRMDIKQKIKRDPRRELFNR